MRTHLGKGQESGLLSAVCKLFLEHMAHFLSRFASFPAHLIVHMWNFEERQFILGERGEETLNPIRALC